MSTATQRFAIFLFAAFWGFVTALGLLWQWCRLGNRFWHKTPHPRPKVLDGWNEDFVQLKEVRLHYVWTGDRSRPLLLLAHGFPEFWYSWRYQLRYFERFFFVVALDMRGYNESSKPSAVSDYRTLTLAKDLRDTILTLGKERAFVMGHDWGAVVCWRLANAFPDVVEKLIILNVPHPTAFQKLIYSNFKQFFKSWYIFMFQVPYLPELAIAAQDYKMLGAGLRGKKGGLVNRDHFTDDDLEAWKHAYSKPNAITGPVNYYRAALQYPDEIEDPRVTPETLIIWGTGDAFLLKEGATNSLAYCEKGRVEFVEGISHWIQQDDYKRVNQLVHDFLLPQ